MELSVVGIKPSICLQVDVQANEKLLTKPKFEKENYRKEIFETCLKCKTKLLQELDHPKRMYCYYFGSYS